MQVRPDIIQFVERLQEFSAQRVRFPQEIGVLFELTNGQRQEQVLQDAIFHATFAVKTKDVMERIGRDGEGFDKLSAEFQTSIEKTATLLKTIVKESPDDIKQHFVRDFFALDQASFLNFTRLLEDLRWIKNWEIDGKPLPLIASRSAEQAVLDNSREELGRVNKSSILGFVLMILFLVIDPPVSYLGWSIASIVIVLLLYIAVASQTLKKTPT